MSRLYETLRRMELQRGKSNPIEVASLAPVELVNAAMAQPTELDTVPLVEPEVSHSTRLVAVTEPRGLAAEKFRALVTRLENKRKNQDLKSLQITSAVAMEGKTLIAGNLAFTLGTYTGSRVLLVEGDLHRPTMASLLGLNLLVGIGHWWSAPEGKDNISNYVCRFKQLPLWFLPAGVTIEHPSHILQSARFAEAFTRLAASFDWIVVDSTPILPVVDTNVWSRLIDGTLLVVREGVTSIASLKKGLATLDNPKLIGVVLNEASEFDRINYGDQYYAVSRPK
jgi:capsular exopolysaccharide synthesis family protein